MLGVSCVCDWGSVNICVARGEAVLPDSLLADPMLPTPVLPAGEEVTFSEIVGMTELNGRAPLRVKGCKAHSFHLEVDSTDFT